MRVLEEYQLIFRRKLQLGKDDLTLADNNPALLVKNQGHKVGSRMEQRDAAIMFGADDAITIIVERDAQESQML